MRRPPAGRRWLRQNKGPRCSLAVGRMPGLILVGCTAQWARSAQDQVVRPIPEISIGFVRSKKTAETVFRLCRLHDNARRSYANWILFVSFVLFCRYRGQRSEEAVDFAVSGQDYWSSASSSPSPTKRIFPNVPTTLPFGPAVKNSSQFRPFLLGVALAGAVQVLSGLEAPPPKSIAQS